MDQLVKLLSFIGAIILFGLFIMYNSKFLSYFTRSRDVSEGFLSRVLGRRMKRWNVLFERTSTLKKGSWIYKVNMYFKDIIINIGLEKDNVTPLGLIIFISSLSFSSSLAFVFFTGEISLFIPAFLAMFYFIVVVFRFMSLVRYEKKEAEIMDTVDLIAMDVKGGVYNAILRYRNSFHQSLRPFFEEFIDNMQNKGYSFREAMLILNDRLGPNFTDFAQKAILYEEKADEDMADIFTAIVEVNRHKRTLRYQNNQKFSKLRLEFLIAIGVISAYAIFAVTTDPFMAHLFKNSFFGKVLLIIDVVAVTSVLAYISSIKSRFL